VSINDESIFRPALDPASVSLPPTVQVDLTWLWTDLGAKPDRH